MSKKDDYVKTLKERLNQINSEVTRLKASAKEAGIDASVKYDNYIEGLREKRDATQKKLEEIHKAGDNAWAHLKDGVEKSWNELKEALAKAKAEFD